MPGHVRLMAEVVARASVVGALNLDVAALLGNVHAQEVANTTAVSTVDVERRYYFPDHHVDYDGAAGLDRRP
jgi:hypothetical protein